MIKIIISLIIVFLTVLISSTEISAQVINPDSWQTGATGLSLNQNADKKTAGLSFILTAKEFPYLSSHGGVKGNGYENYKMYGPTGMDLGFIKTPQSLSASLTSESFDWSHNLLTFTTNASETIKIWTSRITPSLLVNTNSSSLRLFAGNLPKRQFVYRATYYPPSSINNLADAPAYPKYVAYSQNGNVQIQTLSTNDLTLATSDKNWLLVWYGSNSPFTDSNRPLTYAIDDFSNSFPANEAYQADIPILLTFQNMPSTIKHSPEGGIDLGFSSGAGYLTITAPYGREHPLAVSSPNVTGNPTDQWLQTGLPGDLVTKINSWSQRICSYPEKVIETYAYDTLTDTASITEKMTYIDFCQGTPYAPLPPFLSLAKDALKIGFTGTVVNSNINTEFGPTMGIENTDQYTWNLTGFKKYTDSQRQLGTGQVPTELTEILNKQVDALFDSSGNPIHFAPWSFSDQRVEWSGDIYWLNPADTFYHLLEIIPVVDSNRQTKLSNYLQNEITAYPPDILYNLPTNQGQIRESNSRNEEGFESWERVNQETYLTQVPLYNFYPLSRYFELTKSDPTQVLNNGKTVLNKVMAQQDWATFYYFQGYSDYRDKERDAVVVSNRFFAGLVGLTKLSKLKQDYTTENLARALLGKAAVLRLVMATYPRYLYETNLTKLPADPSWQLKYTVGSWRGFLYNANWSGAYDDHRQISRLNQFGIFLDDHHNTDYGNTASSFFHSLHAFLTAYRDMVPELGRFLSDTTKQDALVYLQKFQAFQPNWYLSLAEGLLGNEHNTTRPIDSFQVFLANAWIQRDSPQNLERFTDVPWLEIGDLFYMQKLAETIKAYRGWSWSDSGTPPPLTGDLNQDTKVDILDLRLAISSFGNLYSLFNISQVIEHFGL